MARAITTSILCDCISFVMRQPRVVAQYLKKATFRQKRRWRRRFKVPETSVTMMARCLYPSETLQPLPLLVRSAAAQSAPVLSPVFRTLESQRVLVM